MTPRTCALGLVVVLALLSAGCGDPAARSKPTVPDAADLPRLTPGVHKQTANVPGVGTLRYTVSVPLGLDGMKPVPLIVALHYGGDVTPHYGSGMIDTLVSPAFSELGAVAVAPDALGGGDWTSDQNEKAVVWLTRSAMKSYPIDPKKVLVTGFSMGGQGAWFIGGRHQDVFTAVMPVAGQPAGGSLEWKVPVYVIHSQADEILSIGPAQRQVEQLKAKGADVELRTVSGLTHYQTGRYAAPMREAVPWLKKVWKEP